ncbi:desulfoferrodoxin family protein [Candidatus Omnitrophota bacterium]
MDTFVCGKCGYLAFGQAPDSCPVCGAPKQAFALDAGAIKKPADPNNLTEGDKKHIPVIKIVRQCGLAGPGCVDAHIKVGEILHVTEAKHYIMYIDVYLDNAFIARYHIEPDKLNPILGIHIKGATGKLLALENCNIHGRWVAEAQI